MSRFIKNLILILKLSTSQNFYPVFSTKISYFLCLDITWPLQTQFNKKWIHFHSLVPLFSIIFIFMLRNPPISLVENPNMKFKFKTFLFITHLHGLSLPISFLHSIYLPLPQFLFHLQKSLTHESILWSP